MNRRLRVLGLMIFPVVVLAIACGGEKSPTLATRQPATVVAPTSPAPTPSPTPPAEIKSTEYTVLPGDTLSEIADRFGVTVDQIAATNGIDDVDLINVGQRILIPTP